MHIYYEKQNFDAILLLFTISDSPGKVFEFGWVLESLHLFKFSNFNAPVFNIFLA